MSIFQNNNWAFQIISSEVTVSLANQNFQFQKIKLTRKEISPRKSHWNLNLSFQHKKNFLDKFFLELKKLFLKLKSPYSEAVSLVQVSEIILFKLHRNDSSCTKNLFIIRARCSLWDLKPGDSSILQVDSSRVNFYKRWEKTKMWLCCFSNFSRWFFSSKFIGSNQIFWKSFW